MVSCLDGQLHKGSEDSILKLAKTPFTPMDLHLTLQQMQKKGIDLFIEVGGGQIFGNFLRREKLVKPGQFISLDAPPSHKHPTFYLLNKMGQLFCEGVQLNAEPISY